MFELEKQHNPHVFEVVCSPNESISDAKKVIAHSHTLLNRCFNCSVVLIPHKNVS